MRSKWRRIFRRCRHHRKGIVVEREKEKPVAEAKERERRILEFNRNRILLQPLPSPFFQGNTLLLLLFIITHFRFHFVFDRLLFRFNLF